MFNSWCQIVRFYLLVPNCLVPNCPVLNCPVPKCLTIQTETAIRIWRNCSFFLYSQNPLFLCVKKPFPVHQSGRKAGVTAQALCADLIHLEEIHEDRSTRLSNSLGAPLVLFKDRINLLDYKILQQEWIKGKLLWGASTNWGRKKGGWPKGLTFQ